jgi:hypothetical protein
MQLEVRRKTFTVRSTIGELYVDGKFECYTLEDVVRYTTKVFGQTAIPAGVYKVIITFSNHFKKDLPLLVNVPNYEGVRIHSGNTDADTEGCILVGTVAAPDYVGNSRVAFNRLFAKLKAAKDTITLTIH